MESAGNSGNAIERVTLCDARELILKRVSPEWDWMSRATHDHGRLRFMWENGLFDRIPDSIDHTTEAVELEGDAWNVFMRDVSHTLIAPDATFDRADVVRVLSAMRQLHDEFWGERFPELCSLVDRYTLLSPATAQRERELGNHHGEIISRGWEAFPELVSGDVADAVLAVAEDPSLLAAQLEQFEHTLIHGDRRLGNLGFSGDRVVLIDWGERVGSAPPAVELAWFIGFDAYRMEMAPDDVINEFRRLYADTFDEHALQLALIGGLVQLGGVISLWIVSENDEARQQPYRSELSWWDTAVAKALEVWSPS
jgi:phosphotransferase family enzyme